MKIRFGITNHWWRDQLFLATTGSSVKVSGIKLHLTWTSNVKYFFIFLTIITRYGSLMPSVFLGSAGQVIYVVLTFVPTISSTKLWISGSVMRLMCPFLTFLSHICSGLLPILYKMDKNPLWNVFLNMPVKMNGSILIIFTSRQICKDIFHSIV